MTVPPRATPSPSKPGRSTARIAWILLAALLVSNVPLFLCMPLTADTVYYDLQAENLLAGGVLYRDYVEPNLPGIVWLHAGIRALLGWRSEAIRLADLLILAAAVALLARLCRTTFPSRPSGVWLALLVFAFYLSISEWCHCQRDAWMLLPALAALTLRFRQVRRLAEPPVIDSRRGRGPGLWSRTAADGADLSGGTVISWAAIEGLCWGAAVWIKPHVVVPALACWCLSAWCICSWRRVLPDLAGLLAGGLLAGAAGILWLVQSGTWPHFLEQFLHWNPEYLSVGRQRWSLSRLWGMTGRLFPWIVVHLIAVPIALTDLRRLLRDCRQRRRRRAPSQAGALLSTFYLGWLVQAFALQHLFDYVHAPVVMLGMAVVAARAGWLRRSLVWKPALAAMLFVAFVSSPAVRPDRLACWRECVAQGSTPEVRDRLSDFIFPNSAELQQVAEFLQSQNVRDGELTCWHNSAIYLYHDLQVRPATRYAFPAELLTLFPQRRAEVESALSASRQRYTVTDLVMARLGRRGVEQAETGPGPVVFRTERYLVHQIP